MAEELVKFSWHPDRSKPAVNTALFCGLVDGCDFVDIPAGTRLLFAGAMPPMPQDPPGGCPGMAAVEKRPDVDLNKVEFGECERLKIQWISNARSSL